MGIEVFLLPAGIALIAAAVWTAAFKGALSRPAKTPAVASPQISTEQPTTLAVPEIRVEEPSPIKAVEPAEVAVPAIPIAPIATAALIEAPAPFEEPQTAFTNPAITTTTPMPTDITAVSNIASPVENASPSLVIATPKRTRAKRAPSDGAPKRKRAPRAKKTAIVPATDAVAIPTVDSVTTAGQQQNETPQIIKE